MVYLIAEVGVNHKGDLDYAIEHVRSAKAAGADAVKFQTFKAEELASVRFAKEQVEFFKSVQLKYEDFRLLFEEARKAEIDFLSTPLDYESADYLDSLPVKAFKVSSGDLTNYSLLAFIARKAKHIYLSTGMSNIGEVSDAVSVIRRNGNQDVTLLHTVTLYPTPYECANLLAVRTLAETFDLPVGYSDHTVGNEACYAAVALGATVIEKHFTLDKQQLGPDIVSSADPAEMATLRRGLDIISLALGDGRKIPQVCEDEMALTARRSIFTTKALYKGDLLTPDLLTTLRPGTGIPASQIFDVVGHKLSADVSAGEMLKWDMLEGI
jgi:N,N'-diacetyllegionaminate synthase